MVNGSESFGDVKGFGRATRDTRNNWLQFMFVTHKRYNCFRKQSTINSCTSGFKELEAFGFEFGELGFAGNHVHFLVDVPKQYSVQTAEIMLKSRSAQRMFAAHPGFRKRYPRSSFWSQYEHHQSIGWKSKEDAENYIRNQLKHHNVKIIDDKQNKLTSFTAD